MFPVCSLIILALFRLTDYYSHFQDKVERMVLDWCVSDSFHVHVSFNHIV